MTAPRAGRVLLLLVAVAVAASAATPAQAGSRLQVLHQAAEPSPSPAPERPRTPEDEGDQPPDPEAPKRAGKPEILPLVQDRGAWIWVAGIAGRLAQAMGLQLMIPDAEDRLCISGKKKCPAIEVPSDKNQGLATLFLIHDPRVNAFVTENRRIYVTRGLLEFVESDDELAGVMAELGHLEGKHHRTIQKKQGLLTVLGTLAGVVATGGAGAALAGGFLGRSAGLKYNRRAEHDADRRGLRLMGEAGYHPVGMLSFMERLAKVGDNDISDPISVFFSTHPPTKQRSRNFRRAVEAVGGMQAPHGLSYDLKRSLYAPNLAQRAGVRSSAPATPATTTPPSPGVRIPFLLGKDFDWSQPEQPAEEGLPVDAHRVAFRGWQPLPEDYHRSGGAVVPGAQGLLMNPGTTLIGPRFPLDAETSYLVAARVAARGDRIRAFVGLELLDEEGEVMGTVYTAAAGTFLGAETRRLSGVTHPFGREEMAHGRPVAARLVTRTGRRAEGQLVLEELACLPVGRYRVSVEPSSP